jgi:hypothetical protein
MWSARSGFPPRAVPGLRRKTPRTNDIDIDEQRKTITGRRGKTRWRA